MNKKVSTIFAMAALMGGVFSGSAYAQNTEIKLDDESVKLQETIPSEAVLLGQDGYYLGIEVNGKVKSLDAASTSISAEKKNYYLWTVKALDKTSTNEITKYTFTNVATGDLLSFNLSDGAFRYNDAENDIKADDLDEAAYIFTFGSQAGGVITEAEYNNGKTGNDFVNLSQQLYTFSDVTLPGSAAARLALDVQGEGLSASVTTDLDVYALEDAPVTASTLNKWYNGKGFNLAANGENVLDNLFGGETRIWAFDVPKTGNGITTENGVTGYKVGVDSDRDALIIPCGTYFFTDPVFNGNVGESDFMPGGVAANDPTKINWLASTLIALSSTETKEATNNDRGNGEGFVLRTAKGDEFIFQQNTSEPAGEDLSIWNACFTVADDHANDFPYSISLSKFFYKAGVNDANTKAQTEKANVYLGVSGFNGTEYRVVSRRTGDPVHAFGFTDSSVEDGRSLLNETKTAAVYTIKFVEGTNNDKDLMNKYLTVGSTLVNNSYQWQYEAKGEAIAETSFPAFQWLITAAEKTNANDSKYAEVTFTNRETGLKFTTKLFKEAGEGRYSLSTEDIKKVFPFTVNTDQANTYVVQQQPDVDFDADLIVELKKLDNVDPYAGFLKVDDNTIRTLAFARDKNDTSNKLFGVVELDDNDTPSDPTDDYYRLNAPGHFATDIEGADQWQLVRSSSPVGQSRVFVYNNTATASVDDVANGDKIYAYAYALRRIVDGTETNYFLKNLADSNDELLLSDEDANSDNRIDANELENLKKGLSSNPATSDYSDISFIIKENVDGSVSLLKREDVATATTATDYKPFGKADAEKVIEVVEGSYDYEYDFNDEEVYVSTVLRQNEIKTYLDPRPVEISWSAKDGHITLKSELGNYITMNDDRDGIVVNEEVSDTYYLYVTDEKAVVPSFYITKGVAAENGERMYMFNPVDSAAYYVTINGEYSRKYQWNEDNIKAMFKPGIINETRDTLSLTMKGEEGKKVAKEADDNDGNIWGGLNRFKFQIIEASDAEGYYRIRQLSANAYGDPRVTRYLSNVNDKLTWSNKAQALLFDINEVAAPTANESVSATEVKVIATDGAVNIKNAAGKNVVISTILGQIVANEVLTSDNATISVPAGIAIVSVDGEEAVKVSVR